MPPIARRYALQITIWVLFTAALIGCTATPIAQPSNAASETPASVASLTASLAPSLTLSPTLTPTVAPSPMPDVPLSKSGPWLVFISQEELWAVNPDGTGLTQLTNEENRVITFSVNPVQQLDGKHQIAYLTTEYGGQHGCT